jgi:hypothetical protein
LYLGRSGSAYLNAALDEARVYNTALASTDVTNLYNQANVSITGLTVNSSHSSSYSAQSYNLATGISQYGDVTKNFTTIGTQYLGSSWIKTASADNNVAGVRNFMSFTLNDASTVYVLYDASITTGKPTWLTSQFTSTGNSIVTQQGTFTVYSDNLSAGTITLGSNLDSGTTTGGMYDVLIVPLV